MINKNKEIHSGKLTILVDGDKTSIQLDDRTSSSCLFKIDLTPENI